MHSINFSELRNAFEFVSSGPSSQHNAYICVDNGIIYWTSNVMDLEEQVPDDLETSDRYIQVPHKNDLKLGQGLALSFIDQEIPHEYNFAASLFRKRGLTGVLRNCCNQKVYWKNGLHLRLMHLIWHCRIGVKKTILSLLNLIYKQF